jgi:hypothetical protein
MKLSGGGGRISIILIALAVWRVPFASAQTYVHSSKSGDLTLSCLDISVPTFTRTLRIHNRCLARLRVNICEVTDHPKPDCWRQDIQPDQSVSHDLKFDWATIQKSTIWSEACALSGHYAGSACEPAR